LRHHSGFFLPLSGGADSASTAAIVFVMCKLVMKEFLAGDNEQLRRDVVKVVGEGAVVRTAEEVRMGGGSNSALP
jgi:NAD+ synthase (glutamine-hydrolysing)